MFVWLILLFVVLRMAALAVCVISYNMAVRLTLLQCNYKCFHLQKY